MPASDYLTDRAVKNAKAHERPFKLFDGRGMYLLVNPDGRKYWRLKYRFAGKEKLLALGVYDEITLKRAREKRDEARALLDKGVDPIDHARKEERERQVAGRNTFKAVAEEWYKKQRPKWSEAHASAQRVRLDDELIPALGTVPIATIDPPTILDVLRKIEARGALETLAKTRILASQIFRYAVATNRAKSDPTRDLKGAFQTREARHYARLKEAELPTFLEKLDAYDGLTITKLAMKLLTLTFVRTGELRGATWEEINFDKAEWRIPAERMKGGKEHIVPLSRQAVEVLRELEEITAGEDFMFPNEHTAGKPMSENTILFALYRMGYRGRATGHGFRHTASTILNEQGWNPDWIERQLAHVEKNKIRGTYNAAEWLPDRRRMMQAWADFLDAKREAGENVVSMKRKRA